MIVTRIIKSLLITLHNLDEYHYSLDWYPELDSEEHYESSEQEFDIYDIADVYKEGDTTYIRVINDDHQGGTHVIPIMDSYDELKYIIDHKKEYLK